MAALLASSTNDLGLSGLLIILLVLVLIVLAIGAVWTFAARRASRTPERRAHRDDHGVRGH
jgi:hypothetical protein